VEVYACQGVEMIKRARGEVGCGVEDMPAEDEDDEVEVMEEGEIENAVVVADAEAGADGNGDKNAASCCILVECVECVGEEENEIPFGVISPPSGAISRSSTCPFIAP
jgi:hypothetical protein